MFANETFTIQNIYKFNKVYFAKFYISYEINKYLFYNQNERFQKILKQSQFIWGTQSNIKVTLGS